MPPLKNSKHEIFAQGLFKGLTGKASAIEAKFIYNSDSSIMVTASRLLGNAKIQTRVRELQEQRAALEVARGFMDREERLERLSAIAREDVKGRYSLIREPNISAIKVMNDMTGDNAPAKVDLTAGLKELLEQLRTARLEVGEG